jgi:uncharacterized low-complexity protein
MEKKYGLKPLTAALGTTFVVSLAASPLASATENPFQINDLSGGYMMADAHGEGKCGEGKCGEGKDEGEGKCGEGKCGEGKDSGEGKCGGDKDSGEGKCGA